METNESYTEETVEPAALIEGWTRRLATRVKSKHYCKQKGVPFYKMELPSIIVSYANEGARTKIDELKKVKFSKRSNKAAQGDKSLTVDVDMMIVGGVYQDGVAPV